MQFYRSLKRSYRTTAELLEERADIWLMRNPFAVFTRARFSFRQRALYSPVFAKGWLLVKVMALGYFTANIFTLDFTQPLGGERKIISEYYVLANRIDHDSLEQLGLEPHLWSLYERGMKRGLTQIELLELVKLHEANEPARPLADHLEYLRLLKS